MANYQLWYADDLGNRREPISDVISFEYSKVLGDVGVGVFNVPRRSISKEDIKTDRRVHVIRQVGAANYLDWTGYLRKFDISSAGQGYYVLGQVAEDLNSLLKRRIIAYYANSSQADKSGEADDMMKTIVNNNLIGNADYSGTPTPARDIDSYGFSRAASSTQGPSISLKFAWQNMLDVLQDIQAAAKANGTEVFFGVVPTSDTTMMFKTWINQPGRNRTVGTGHDPIVFSEKWGNLENAKLSYDFTEEQNFIYAGGRGQNDARIIQTAYDSTRIFSSRVARTEGFIETGAELNAPTLAMAKQELERRRSKTIMTGRLISTPNFPYGGSGWDIGDKVTVNYAGLQLDVLIRSVHVKVDEDKKETIWSKIEE